MQAVKTLHSTAVPGDVCTDAAFLAQLTASESTPCPSRVDAIQWLIDSLFTLQQCSIQTSPGPSDGQQLRPSADPEPRLPVSDTKEDNAHQRAAGRPSGSHSGHAFEDKFVASTRIDALLVAMTAVSGRVRAAAAVGLKKLVSDFRRGLSTAVYLRLTAVAAEGLSSVDSDAQRASQQLLFALLANNEASDLCKQRMMQTAS